MCGHHLSLFVVHNDAAHFAARGGDGGHLIQLSDIVLRNQISGNVRQVLRELTGDDELMARAFTVGAEHDGCGGEQSCRHHEPGREQHRARGQTARSNLLHDASECAHDVSSTPTRAGAREDTGGVWLGWAEARGYELETWLKSAFTRSGSDRGQIRGRLAVF